MPNDSDSESSSDSSKRGLRWCGLIIQSSSTRPRRNSEGDHNRTAMPTTRAQKRNIRNWLRGSKSAEQAASAMSSGDATAPHPVPAADSAGYAAAPVESNAGYAALPPPGIYNAGSAAPSGGNSTGFLDKGTEKARPEDPGEINKRKYNEDAAFEIFQKNLVLKDSQSKYTKVRQGLLKEEFVWDWEAKQDSSNKEKDADTIVRALREYERTAFFGNIASEAIPGPTTRDMGGQFLTNKNRIEASELFSIAEMFPKGGLLHLHFNAELDPVVLLKEARDMPNIFVRSILPLKTTEDLDKTEMVFSVMPEDTYEANIFDRGYRGTATNFRDKELAKQIWMRWAVFRKEFNRIPEFSTEYAQPPTTQTQTHGNHPDSSDQAKKELDPAEIWLLKKMVLSEKEAYSPEQTVNGVWARFNQATRCFKGLLNYEKVYKWYIGKAIDGLIAEKVMYAELRPMLLDKSIPMDDGIGKIDNAGQMRLISEAIEEKKIELDMAGKQDDFPFGLKIIYCTPRSISKDLMIREMQDCIKLKLEFPKLICGFDLVGAEDRPNHIGFYKEELQAFSETCKSLCVSLGPDYDIPFLFHAGETLLDTGGSTDPANSNLYDSVLLKSKRIGHGYSLLKHPQLIPYFRKTDESPGICIELCPISNELLHLCRNIKEHPFPQLLAAGIPCTINSDNPSLFSNSMNHEFYQVMVGAPTMSIYSWKQLARWSIEYSCLSDGEKKQGYEIFDRRWEEFCAEIVGKYGDLIQGGQVSKVELERIYGQRLADIAQSPRGHLPSKPLHSHGFGQAGM